MDGRTDGWNCGPVDGLADGQIDSKKSKYTDTHTHTHTHINTQTLSYTQINKGTWIYIFFKIDLHCH
jgi:hypothetical protein